MRKRALDDGMSLVEVIIAMFLLAVLSLAVLPLIIGATRVSVTNKDLIAATTLANARLAPLRAAYSLEPASPQKCDALTAAIAALPTSDAQNPGLTITVAASPEYTQSGVPVVCPSDPAKYPLTVLVTATVKNASGTLATVPTRLLVAGKS